MILFTSALSVELNSIKESIKNININSKYKINFLLTWVWVENTIYEIKNYLSKNNVSFIVNIWVCWLKEQNIDLDFFQVYKINKLSNKKESICPIYIDFLYLKTIDCSDKIITDKNDLYENYVDMESYWVDFICSKEKIPYLIIKKPFDIVWINSKKVNKNDIYNSLKELDYKNLIEKINIFLDKNLYKNENIVQIEYFVNNLKTHLTFSEKEKLKKDISKEISFKRKKEDIFEEILKKYE